MANKNPRRCRGGSIREPNRSSEIEAEQLAGADKATTNQSTETHRVGDAAVGDHLCEDPDCDAHPGGSSSAGVGGLEIAGAAEHVGRHAGENNDQADNGGDGCGVVGAHGAQPRPIWERMPWPVRSSVARPITKPSMAKRPFQVSANATKPKREEESAMGCFEVMPIL